MVGSSNQLRASLPARGGLCVFRPHSRHRNSYRHYGCRGHRLPPLSIRYGGLAHGAAVACAAPFRARARAGHETFRADYRRSRRDGGLRGFVPSISSRPPYEIAGGRARAGIFVHCGGRSARHPHLGIHGRVFGCHQALAARLRRRSPGVLSRCDRRSLRRGWVLFHSRGGKHNNRPGRQ